MDRIENIKKASKIGDEAFEYISAKLKLGISEKEVSSLIKKFINGKGASLSFRPIVAFGKNSATPHHKPTNKKLTNNTIVLLDLGAKYNGFCSDMTRTVFFGKASSKFKKMYLTVLSAQKKARYAINNGELNLSSVDKIARKFIIKRGFPSIPHSLGHGIGKKVHQAPRISPGSKANLKKGTMFTIEPGIYIPNFGGVRIEDLFYFNGKIAQLISKAQKEIIEL